MAVFPELGFCGFSFDPDALAARLNLDVGFAMSFDSRFAALAFTGEVRIEQLQISCSVVPDAQGVYAVVRESTAPVQFLATSCGGRFKNRDPSVDIATLEERWLAQAKVLYIGKAGGTELRSTLRKRLHTYMQFGLGCPCAHWGGRYIWQLADAAQLLVLWAPTSEPAKTESLLLDGFTQSYGQLPFANLRR